MFKIGDVLERHHVIPGLNSPDKRALLEELAHKAALALKIDEKEIHAALQAREQLGSTGVGNGIAIPHARIAGLTKPFGMFVRLERAIDFSAIDAQPADLIFLLLTPDQSSGIHLSALAAISRRLRDTGTAWAIRGANNAVEIFNALADEPRKAS